MKKSGIRLPIIQTAEETPQKLAAHWFATADMIALKKMTKVQRNAMKFTPKQFPEKHVGDLQIGQESHILKVNCELNCPSFKKPISLACHMIYYNPISIGNQVRVDQSGQIKCIVQTKVHYKYKLNSTRDSPLLSTRLLLPCSTENHLLSMQVLCLR